jgi:hypothetical protein
VIGLDFAALDCPINDVIAPSSKDRKQRAEADHAFAERRGNAEVVHRYLRIHSQRDLAHPNAEARDDEPQAYHRDVRPLPGKTCAFVGENLGFDLVRIELPLFVRRTFSRPIQVGYPSSVRFPNRARSCATAFGRC